MEDYKTIEYKWYSGKYDRAFKEVMLYENNRDLLTMLLEKILNVKIEELKVINNEKLVHNVHVKNQRLDLNLKTNIGKINVEVNSSQQSYIHRRNMAYLCDTYAHDILVGEEYNDNTMYIQINLSYGLNKNIKPIRQYQVMNEELEAYVNNLYIYDINMDYYMNLWYSKDVKEVDNNIILVMLGLDKKDLEELSKKNRMVSKYMEELNRVNENPEFREYMSYEEDQRKIKNTLISEARQEGIEQSKILIIKNLLAKNIEISEIAEIVELPEERVLEIKEKS